MSCGGKTFKVRNVLQHSVKIVSHCSFSHNDRRQQKFGLSGFLMDHSCSLI